MSDNTMWGDPTSKKDKFALISKGLIDMPLDDNDPKNESPSHSNSKKRKASDIDTQPSSSMINQQQPILIIQKKGDKKHKIKPKQTDNKKIKTDSSKKDCTKSSTSSLLYKS